MKKVYIEAQYRIPNQVYNHGYICIDEDENEIKGIFSLDLSTIKIVNNTLIFYLREFDSSTLQYNLTEKFTCHISSDTLESPNIYILNSSSSGRQLELELIKRVSNLYSDIISNFNTFFGM